MFRAIDKVTAPRRPYVVEVVALTVEQTRALLAAAAGNRFKALFELAVKTGMRRANYLRSDGRTST